jgi:phosphoribosylanthranilate isomerase
MRFPKTDAWAKLFFSFHIWAMALITKVKAGSVSSLSDARYFAGMGVDWLGFDVNPDSPHYVSLELYQSMAGWVTGPKRVIEMSAANPEAVKKMIATYAPDFFEVDASQVSVLKGLTDVPLMARLDLDTDQPNMQALAEAKYVVLTVQDALKKKEIIQNISQVVEVLLTVTPHEPAINNLLTLLPISGICLKGSPEIKVGLKDYSFADLLESLEEA